MKNILLLAMSTLPKKIEEHYYYYQDRKPFPAKSQLEPITHMLVDERGKKGEKLDKVIILETDETVRSEEGEKSAVDFYKERVGIFAKGIEYVDIHIDENDPIEGISEAIRVILQEYKGNDNDELKLWIDTQGGFRDIVMVLNAIISLLREQGIEPEGIFSVRFSSNSTEENPCPIIDQTKKYGIFKFVSSMQEFMDFGKSKGLKKYYAGESDLVQAIDKIADAIQMCQPQKFEEALGKFAEYLNSGQYMNDDPYLQIFVEFIKKDYGLLLEEPDNTVEQIRWCVHKEFYQQAITIYTEKIPKYYNDHGIIELKVDPEKKSDHGKNLYADAFYETMFDEMLKDPDDESLNTILNGLVETLKENTDNAGKNEMQKAKQYLTRNLETGGLTQNVETAINRLKEELNERFDCTGKLRLPKDRKANKVQGYINSKCTKGERYRLLYGEDREKEETCGKKIRAIKEAKEKTPNLVKCMEYYLAMKLLRNRMNHASEDEIKEDEQKAIEFLKSEQIDIGIEINDGRVEVDYQKIKKLITEGLESIG